MSEKGIPVQGGSVAVDMVRTTTATNTQNSVDPNMIQLWKFIYIDMTFVKSIIGILVAVETLLSLIALICAASPSVTSCVHSHSSTYSYFEFVTSSCMVTAIIWYALFALAITKKLNFVPWELVALVWCGFYALNYLIASCILAAHMCHKTGLILAMIFGFACLVVVTANGYLIFKPFWEKRKANASSSTSGSGQQAAETDSVQY